MDRQHYRMHAHCLHFWDMVYIFCESTASKPIRGHLRHSVAFFDAWAFWVLSCNRLVNSHHEKVSFVALVYWIALFLLAADTRWPLCNQRRRIICRLPTEAWKREHFRTCCSPQEDGHFVNIGTRNSRTLGRQTYTPISQARKEMPRQSCGIWDTEGVAWHPDVVHIKCMILECFNPSGTNPKFHTRSLK